MLAYCEPGEAAGERAVLECIKNPPPSKFRPALGGILKIGTPPPLGVVWLLLAVTCGYSSATYLARASCKSLYISGLRPHKLAA